MIARIGVIAKGAFREAVRSKIFVNLLAVSALVLVGGIIMEGVALGDPGRVFHDLAHAAISISGSMIAIFVGIQLIATDIERKTLHIILARPVTRFEVLVGKYLGLAAVLAVNTLVAVALYALAALGGQWTSLTAGGVLAILFLYFEFLVVGAIAIMFSAMSGATSAAIYTLMVFVIGRLGQQMGALAERGGASIYHELAGYFRIFFPDLTRFDLVPTLATSDGMLLLGNAVYALIWCAVALLLGTIIFNKRDLK